VPVDGEREPHRNFVKNSGARKLWREKLTIRLAVRIDGRRKRQLRSHIPRTATALRARYIYWYWRLSTDILLGLSLANDTDLLLAAPWSVQTNHLLHCRDQGATFFPVSTHSNLTFSINSRYMTDLWSSFVYINSCICFIYWCFHKLYDNTTPFFHS